MKSTKAYAILAAWVGFAFSGISASAADAPRSLDGVLDYQFAIHGFGHGPENGEKAEQRTVIMLLRVVLKQCVSFDCSRQCDQKTMQIETWIGSAALVRKDGGRGSGSVSRAYVSVPWDDTMETLCPDADPDKLVSLLYPINKWDIGPKGGTGDDTVRRPVVARLAVALDVYVFKEGRRVKAGTLESAPFYVRVTDELFEFSDAPFD